MMSQLESTFQSKTWEICSKNKIKVNLIDNGLRDLKEEIEDISEEEKETKDPNEIIENIFEFNRQQQGQGLKY